jgi:hypothetical protein
MALAREERLRVWRAGSKSELQVKRSP